MTPTFFFIFAAWIFSLCIHEFAHAVVAYQGGDYTVKDKGYLSLNPLKFMHPMLSLGIPLLILLIGGIGLPGGAVYIERHLLRSRGWDCMVSLAGPMSNLVLAFILALPFMAGFVEHSTDNAMWNAVAFLIQVQIVAVVLNLVPVPGLDGFGVVSAWMDEKLRQQIYQYANMLIIVFIIVMLNVREASLALWTVVEVITGFMGVPREMAMAGFEEFLIF